MIQVKWLKGIQLFTQNCTDKKLRSLCLQLKYILASIHLIDAIYHHFFKFKFIALNVRIILSFIPEFIILYLLFCWYLQFFKSTSNELALPPVKAISYIPFSCSSVLETLSFHSIFKTIFFASANETKNYFFKWEQRKRFFLFPQVAIYQALLLLL